MEAIDLNITNYNLKDILSLFQVPYDFNENHMRGAKKLVLKMHPDKCGLDKEYFLFFSSAYKILYRIYQFRNKSTAQSSEYIIEEDEEEREKKLLLKQIEGKDPKEFNSWFNKMFEKTKLRDEDADSGYGEWLKSNEDIDARETTQVNMNASFEKKKTEVRSLIERKEVESMTSSFFDLSRDKPMEYSSDVFSSLPYEDLRKAHRESVIPVTQEDNQKKYNNMGELERQRSVQDVTMPSLEQAQKYLKEKKNGEDESTTERAYKLARQDEEVQKANKLWWSKFRQLT